MRWLLLLTRRTQLSLHHSNFSVGHGHDTALMTLFPTRILSRMILSLILSMLTTFSTQCSTKNIPTPSACRVSYPKQYTLFVPLRSLVKCPLHLVSCTQHMSMLLLLMVSIISPDLVRNVPTFRVRTLNVFIVTPSLCSYQCLLSRIRSIVFIV